MNGKGVQTKWIEIRQIRRSISRHRPNSSKPHSTWSASDLTCVKMANDSCSTIRQIQYIWTWGQTEVLTTTSILYIQLMQSVGWSIINKTASWKILIRHQMAVIDCITNEWLGCWPSATDGITPITPRVSYNHIYTADKMGMCPNMRALDERIRPVWLAYIAFLSKSTV